MAFCAVSVMVYSRSTFSFYFPTNYVHIWDTKPISFLSSMGAGHCHNVYTSTIWTTECGTFRHPESLLKDESNSSSFTDLPFADFWIMCSWCHTRKCVWFTSLNALRDVPSMNSAELSNRVKGEFSTCI